MDFSDLANIANIFVKITQPLVFFIVLRFILNVFKKPVIYPEADISQDELCPDAHRAEILKFTN
jgi:hypothetical protein